jgi:hypothetical protein
METEGVARTSVEVEARASAEAEAWALAEVGAVAWALAGVVVSVTGAVAASSERGWPSARAESMAARTRSLVPDG